MDSMDCLLEESFSAAAWMNRWKWQCCTFGLPAGIVALFVVLRTLAPRLFWWISSNSDDGHKTGEAVAFVGHFW